MAAGRSPAREKTQVAASRFDTWQVRLEPLDDQPGGGTLDFELLELDQPTN